VTQLAQPVEFELKSIYQSSLAGPEAQEIERFNKDIIAAQKRSSKSSLLLAEIDESMQAVREAIDRTPGDVTALEEQYANIQTEINAINFELNGLQSRDRKGIKPANINSRLGYAMSAMRSSYGPTEQHREQLTFASDGLDAVSKRVNTIYETTLPALQEAIVKTGGPWTVGAPVAL
jgi:septal ring factor EnvC (AmiA/AmiB activator)